MVYRCPYFLWDTGLIYGSSRVLYVYDLRPSKLVNRVEVDENIFSIWVDQVKGLIFLGCDNKTYMIYDSSFNLLATRKFGKKISFVTKFEDQLIVGDHFGDVSILDYRSVAGSTTDNDSIPATKPNQSDSNVPDTSVAKNKGEKDSPAPLSADRLLVPYSHYSTITASLIRGSSLFTGDKDGKIVLNSMANLHEIKTIFLAHKMYFFSIRILFRSISFMDAVEDRLLVSLSIDSTLRLWCLSTGTELLCIGLPETPLASAGTVIDQPVDSADSSLNTDLRYNLACSYRNRLIVVPYLHLLLVILFDFDKMQLLGHSVLKLPFVVQLCLFVNDTLFLVDEWSSLHSLDCPKIVSSVTNTSTGTTLPATPSAGSASIFSTNKRVDLSPLAECLQLHPALLHDDLMRNRGAKINLTKHVYV